jgi:type IV secretion system protein VirB4
VDDPLRRGLAIQWLLDLMEDYGVAPDARVQAHLGSNVAALATLPPDQRTLSRLATLMADGSRETGLRAKAGRIDAQGIAHPDMDLRALVVLWQEIRTVLLRFTEEGEYGGLFDGTADVFDASPIQTFELRALMQRPRLLGPVLRYVLQEIELRMSTDRPMLLLLDDAAIPWAVPKMEEKSKEWMMTTRKKSVSLGFMSHSLAQIFAQGRTLGLLLAEGCPTRFYLANKEAETPLVREVYERMGLTRAAIRVIATATPQRDIYYSCQELGQRLFHLPLGPLTLACTARNAAEDHERMDKLLEQEGREGFAAAWLRVQGYDEEAIYVERFRRRDDRADPERDTVLGG